MSYHKERKRYFRISEAEHTKKEAFFSSVPLLLVLLLGLWITSFIANAENQSGEQIRQAVETALQQEVAQVAKQRNWQSYQADRQIWLPGSANYLPECSVPLTVSAQDNQLLPIGHLKRLVRCETKESAWQIAVTVKASLSLPVVVVKTPIARGGSIDASMLKLESRTLTRQEDFLTRIADATGKETTRRMRAGQILNPMLISKPPLAMKGNQVVIIASKDGINASTQGVALENGGLGDQIEVKNSSSQTVIHAVVTGLNQVHTQF